MPRLDVYTDLELILQVKIREAPLWIGRGSSCGISLNDPFVSRHHAQVRPITGGWEIASSGRNGTRLNTEPLTAPAALRFGDRIYIGKHALIFQADDAPVLKRDAKMMGSTQAMQVVQPDTVASPLEEPAVEDVTTVDLDRPRS